MSLSAARQVNLSHLKIKTRPFLDQGLPHLCPTFEGHSGQRYTYGGVLRQEKDMSLFLDRTGEPATQHTVFQILESLKKNCPGLPLTF